MAACCCTVAVMPLASRWVMPGCWTRPASPGSACTMLCLRPLACR